MYKDKNRLFRFILITSLVLSGLFLVSCDVTPYQCRQVTYLNGAVYSATTWEADNFTECYCWEYSEQIGNDFWEVRCE